MYKYRRGERVGEGAHGVVYKAEVLPEGASGTPRSGKKRSHTEAFGSSSDADGGIKVFSLEDTGVDSDSSADERKRSKEERKSDHHGAGDEKDGASAEKKQKIVALKKIRLKDSKEGLSLDAIREIKVLQELDHPNVMKVLDVFNHKSNIHVVMEFMEQDLDNLIRSREVVLKPADVKQYLQMLLLAVEHCHGNWILHRDIKPMNLLIASDGQLKLADFGLAKVFGSPERELSPQACTLWYRAPELLFGARHYGPAADMWSVGCVFAELMKRSPMFPGTKEMHQLQLIISVLGSPTEADWPHVTSLKDYLEFEKVEPKPLQDSFPAATPDAIDLLKKLLVYDPAKRLSAKQALEHAYFKTKPAPTPAGQLPRLKQKKSEHVPMSTGAGEDDDD